MDNTPNSDLIPPEATAALSYFDRGWTPIRTRFKRPYGDGWQLQRPDRDTVRQWFENESWNIGILLGQPSNWLVDVDLDHPLAVHYADQFLPATNAKFGREGKPLSHWLYIAPNAKSMKRAIDGDSIVELRSTGCQTVFPPGMWVPKQTEGAPQGLSTMEQIRWDTEGEPTAVDAETLAAAVESLYRHVQRELGLSPPPSSTTATAVAHADYADLDDDDVEEARRAIKFLPPMIADSYEDWIRVGMAMRSISDSLLPDYVAFSRMSSKFREGEPEKKWRSFNRTGVGAGTLFQIAKRFGYQPALSNAVNLMPYLQRVAPDIYGNPATPPSGSLVDPASAAMSAPDNDGPSPIRFPRLLTAGALIQACPSLRQPIIDGLLRRGETMNVVAPPKTGKSWMTIDLALAIATGNCWFGFPCTHGRVLVLDNELHMETSANRIPKVADARGYERDEWASRMSIANLRGFEVNVESLTMMLRHVNPGDFDVVVLDAWYRFLAIDENDNGAMRDAYNKLDMLAAKLNAALIAVHHASKGNQAGKSITDVGAGAGSQSRAADCHLVLREHETPGILVMDAVTRSFPAPAPVCIRREFPVFHIDATADPTALKSDRPSRKPKEKTEETAPPPAPPKPQRASIEDLLECASETPQQEAAIQAVAEKRGMTTKRFKELFKQATATERLHLWKIETADGRFKLYAKIPQENTQSAQST